MRPLPPVAGRLVLLAALAFAVGAAPVRGDEATLQRLLADAQFEEKTRGEFAAALAGYEQVLKATDATPRLRGAALLGSARCREATGDLVQAALVWDQILEDTSLPAEVRAEAEKAKAARKERASSADAEATRLAEAKRELDARHKEEHRRFLEHLQRAQAALAERNFDTARHEAYAALTLEEDNTEARDLLDLIEQQRPDRGELIRSLMHFFQSLQSEEFQRLKNRIRDLEETGRGRYNQADLVAADLAFRDAIRLVDASEFRQELDEERDTLALWLRQTRDAGNAKGIAFGEEPVPPAETASATGLKGRFFALLEEAFSSREDGTDPLRFYELAPAPILDGHPHRALGPNKFADGVSVEQSASTLTRARWAEKWIRFNLSTAWASGDRPATRGPGVAGPAVKPPLLERFGDVLFLQHRDAVHREVAELKGSFAKRAPPLQVDVAVYAAGPGGAVRAATALRVAPASPRESGLDSVVPGRLIEECRRDLQSLENLVLLGTAQVNFDGDVAATLEITERTDRSPLYESLPPPLLSVPSADLERYGLFLDLYAEDLPGAKKGTQRQGALSVVARARHLQPSFVVRKNDPKGEWTRLPRMAERTVESDRSIAHAATLVLLGLGNPFAATAGTHPDLVILLGIRPGASGGRDAPVPDPPQTYPTETVPDRPEAQEYDLGPLATEVVDALVLDGWPLQSPASVPLPEGTARRNREDFLARWIAQRARLWSDQRPNPVTVHDHVASAAVPAEEQVRIGEAVQLLTSQAAALYEVTALAVEAPSRLVEAWARAEGISQIIPGAWLVSAPAAGPLDAQMRGLADPSSLFGVQADVPARPTQQVVMLNLHTQSFVKDIHVTRSADGKQRYRFASGIAEEGLVLEVRPGVEEDGRTLVTLRARATRLQGIAPVVLQGVEQKAAAVQVPTYHPLADRSTRATLNDQEALLLVLDVPGTKGRVIAVKVVVKRVQ